MLISGNPAIETLVRRDMARTLAGAIDDEALNGGGAPEPTGILNTGSINTTAFSAAPTWAKVLEMVELVGVDNALMGSLAFMGNAATQQELRTTLVTATYGDRMIMEDPNQLAGYPFFLTNYLAGDPTSSPAVDGVLLFGNFEDLLLGYWTALDLVVNPYHTTVYAKGGVLILAMQDTDVTVRHPESFCTGTAITLS
jgi:HK97 family phage major capsid protein